ncbi:imelysin family protein [Fodinibius sp. Rm-B-1B1-1]|uniref:imelysin family protein n=1 Tax=Fodinibius alkaliphilus TaxID=3140241 RepID=UPI00315A358F
MLQHKTPYFSILLLFFVVACSSSTNPDETTNFDRAAMLENYGNNIILPAFEDMQSAVNELQTAADNFKTERTTGQLENLQTTLKQSRLAWQNVSPFQFGPAESVLLRASLNTYPTDTDKISENIESGDYSMESISNQDAAGLPALDYLLHGVGGTNEEILAAYTTDPNAQNRLDYLLENINYIKSKVDKATSEWQTSGGDYIGMFLSEDNAGTDVGSSLGMLINSYVMHYERFLRDGKIGIPAGVRSAGTPRPVTVEAYYGGYSAELAVANFEQVERIFTGGNSRGLDDNLEALNAGDLADEIQTQIDETKTALEALNDPLSQQIEENKDPVLTVFEEMQQVVTLVKADMTSILGITITYQDNDGD